MLINMLVRLAALAFLLALLNSLLGCATVPDAPLTYRPAWSPSGHDCLWTDADGWWIPRYGCRRGRSIGNVCLFTDCESWS
jgi:hypothetical protein